jgi:toxin ParE1/3/4
MKLDFSQQARLDLLSILHHIAADKPQAATRFVEELEKRCGLLAAFPGLGTPRDDLLPSLRLFVFRGYGIYFHVIEDGVSIERVFGPGFDDTPSDF